jgi:hypothetical protein
MVAQTVEQREHNGSQGTASGSDRASAGGGQITDQVRLAWGYVVVESATKIMEIIRLQQCLHLRCVTTERKGEKVQNFYPSHAWRDHRACPPEWVDAMRKSFESHLECDERRRSGGGMIGGNGFVGFIEPGSYASSDVNRKWESFIRGAISHRLLLLSGQISG